MSHFLYAHKDLTNTPDVWKIGIAITPYSAVRARQKFCWQQFGLDHLWFGFPTHIEFIEEYIKHDLRLCSGKTLQNLGTQTEMFKIDIKVLKHKINNLIKTQGLCVMEIPLDQPYVASNSGQCPFRIPGEKQAEDWLNEKAKKQWPDKIQIINQPIYISTSKYQKLFEEC